jgi:hypothetical protein
MLILVNGEVTDAATFLADNADAVDFLPAFEAAVEAATRGESTTVPLFCGDSLTIAPVGA